VKGSFALVRTKEAKNWLLIKHKDRFVTSDDVTAQDRSVLAGRFGRGHESHPAHRIPASQLVPAGRIEAMPEMLEPMHAESGAGALQRSRLGCGSPSSTAIGRWRSSAKRT
jgi:bifunctional non-homologous end joining protein LigD